MKMKMKTIIFGRKFTSNTIQFFFFIGHGGEKVKIRKADISLQALIFSSSDDINIKITIVIMKGEVL